jgi:hypothetical protein
MEKSHLWNKIGIQAGILVLFIALSYLYLFPLLEGKQLAQHDIQSHAGMAKELIDYRNETGKEAIWTNSMFGGMPGYMISVTFNSNLLNYIQNLFRSLFSVAAFLILYMVGFYILLSSLKIEKWLSFAGALAFGFSTYLLTIITAGHNTKAMAIGYLMIVFAGILTAYRYNRWKGAVILSVGLAFEILASHPQITYYGLLTAVVFGITELVYAIREKRIPAFLKTTGLLVVAALLAVAVNFSYLYTTYKYSKQTIRGKSELTHNAANQTSGLDKDYVVQWSQGISETFTLIIPGYMGGSHTTNPGIDSESYKALQKSGIENPKQVIRQVILYHGEKPFTSGPYYVGAIVVFLFVLGLFVVKGADKWWLLTATIMSIILSWGKYVMPLTSFLLDYLPLYNKFRAPEMTLVIAGFTIPLLGFLGLRNILTGKIQNTEFIKALKWSFGITGGICLMFSVFPGFAGDFSAPFDGSYPDWLLGAVKDDRMAMLRGDAFRSLIFITLSAGLLLLWNRKKLKTGYFFAGLSLLIVVDLWFVDKRFLNNDNFQSKREAKNENLPSPVDLEILKDQDLSYRVLPLQNPWQDSRASYFHKNLGGYSAAKLRRFQEMIDHHFSPEIEQMVKDLQGQKSPDSVFSNLTAINMLNTKYIIYDLNSAPLRNPSAFGNAWVSPGFRIVANADEEIEALSQINPKEITLIDQRFSQYLENKKFERDTNAIVTLTEYKPNYLKYNSLTSKEQLVVFSEIYYPDGWKSFVDGRETPHFRANYILRAMVVPAGEHTIEFRFHPNCYYTGNKVSMAGSILLILALAGYFIFEYRKKNM